MPEMIQKIEVEMSVTVNGQALMKGYKVPINVNALGCVSREIPVPASDKMATSVPFLTTLQKAPDFLLVLPVNDKGDPLTLDPQDLYFSVYLPQVCDKTPSQEPTAGENKKHYKPLLGAQVFFNGAVEWMTDLTGDDTGSKMPTLYFWNGTRKPIKVQIVVGYSPY